MTTDASTFASMVKVHYSKEEVENICYSENPLWAAIGKKKGKLVGGSGYSQPVGLSLVGGGSVTFATANAATTNQSNFSAYLVPQVAHYRVPKITNQIIEQTMTGDEDAFEKALLETNRGIEAEANYLNFRMYRGRGGYIGRMTNTGFATTALTVDDPACLHAVQAGDVLQLSVTDGTSGAVKAGTVTVAGVIHPTASGGVATITLTGNVSAGVATAAANDYIFLNGDHATSAGFSSMTGFADYIPDTAAGALTTLHGFVRSSDSRLGGAIVDGTGISMYELITNMLTATSNYGGKTRGSRTIVCHPFAVGDLVKQLDGKWITSQATSLSGAKSASVGYDSVSFDMMGLKAQLIIDRMCPVSRVYGFDVDNWIYQHSGMAPTFLLQKQTGHILKPSETIDGWECRIGEYGNLGTSAPHKNIVGIRS